MRTVTYYKDIERKQSVTLEYDEEAPCIRCGEPVLSASMGGTGLCPSCDLGKCRYCKQRIDVMYDKEEVLDHMKQHHEKNPELVKFVNEVHRIFNKKFGSVAYSVVNRGGA